MYISEYNCYQFILLLLIFPYTIFLITKSHLHWTWFIKINWRCPNQYTELSLIYIKQITYVPNVCMIFFESSGLCTEVGLIYWVVKTYSWYYETKLQVSYLVRITSTKPNHPTPYGVNTVFVKKSQHRFNSRKLCHL